MLPIFKQVPAAKRKAIKTNVDKIGRKAFAEAVGESYVYVSHRLTGKAPLSTCIAEHYERTIASMIDPRSIQAGGKS